MGLTAESYGAQYPAQPERPAYLERAVKRPVRLNRFR